MDLFNLRRDFSLKTLSEEDVLPSPIAMLQQWLDEAMRAEALEPSAMTISTVSEDGKPSSRVVLVKEIRDDGFTFFTNYDSRKGMQLAENSNIAVNFIWHELERQVRVEGQAQKLSPQESDAYFSIRPPKSKLGAWASPQSQVIASREALEKRVLDYEKQFEHTPMTRPPQWGGYLIVPSYFEFWQGRASRLHDRIQYRLEGKEWKIERLAP